MSDNAKVVLWSVVALAVVAALSVGFWAFKVASAPIKGAGDAFMQKESADNRIAKQERFEELYQEAQASSVRIVAMAAAVDADPNRITRTNLTGAVTYCLGVVADYNAEARKYTAAQFRAADLPAELDPITYCEDPTR